MYLSNVHVFIKAFFAGVYVLLLTGVCKVDFWTPWVEQQQTTASMHIQQYKEEICY